MIRTARLSLITAALVCLPLVGIGLAQQRSAPNIPASVERSDRQLTLPAAIKALTAQQAPAAKVRKTCRVFISKDNTAKTIVLDDTGVYMEDVREVRLAIVIGARFKPIAQLKSWGGVFKPAAAKIKTDEWMAEIEIVDEAKFESLLNGSAPVGTAAPPSTRGPLEDVFEE